MKKCKKCDINKSLLEYCKRKDCKDGLHIYCKECQKVESNKYYSIHKKEHNDRTNSWSRKNKEYHMSLMKPYKENKEYHREYNKKRMLVDPMYRLRHSVNALINHHLKYNKISRSIEYLGCTIDEYKQHLESQFKYEMNWDNYGSYWEIDHIYPLSKGGSFHYTNTQPLTVKENRIKSDKVL
jgi:hypothetical protein